MKTKIAIIAIIAAGIGIALANMKCPICKGTGWDKNLKCTFCNGSGNVGR